MADIREYAQSEDKAAGKVPWNVSTRTLRRYLAASDVLLERQLETDRKKNINRHLGMRRALYARAVASGDWRTALAIIRDEAELLSLYHGELIERLEALEATQQK